MKIAAIGLTHDHIYGQVNCLLRAGADLTAFHETDEPLAAAFAQGLPAGEARRRPGARSSRTTPSPSCSPPPSRPTAPRSRSPPCATART